MNGPLLFMMFGRRSLATKAIGQSSPIKSERRVVVVAGKMVREVAETSRKVARDVSKAVSSKETNEKVQRKKKKKLPIDNQSAHVKKKKKVPTQNEVQSNSDGLTRCSWAKGELYEAYHDQEWGKVVRNDENKLFEMLSLEGAQAGLSWITVLQKRENYRKHFHSFDIDQVAKMTSKDVDKILEDPGVIRHRGKLESVVKNAQLVQKVQAEFGSFEKYLYQFAPESRHHGPNKASNPSFTSEAETMSKDLKKRGFKFCGPTIMYAFMQAVGMVDDHQPQCFLHREKDEL